MNIEPLKSILEWSPDKKDTLLYYLHKKERNFLLFVNKVNFKN